jgi:AcrR family transcriptional regulator
MQPATRKERGSSPESAAPKSDLQRTSRSSATKERILAAAEEVFAAKGFDGASTRDIAAAARVNISSLHYHWETKERLYYAVFESIYDRVVALVRSSIPDVSDGPPPRSAIIDEAMGSLFDFFSSNPGIVKLLVRRLLEATDRTSDIEREILLPAWGGFAAWTVLGRADLEEIDARIFMLTVHSVLLLFMLDSQQFVTLLGDSVRSPKLNGRLRRHIIDLVRTLMRRERSGRGS